MNKPVTESAENSISVEKSKPSDSPINIQRKNEVSFPSSAVEPWETEAKMDITSNFFAETLPDSAVEISIPLLSSSAGGVMIL